MLLLSIEQNETGCIGFVCMMESTASQTLFLRVTAVTVKRVARAAYGQFGDTSGGSACPSTLQ